MEERLQKILARAGYGSRRSCEELISMGRVRVNGHPAILGSKADPTKDHISVDGTALPKAEPLVYIALNKPRGIISTVDDPLNRTTVRDLIPLSGTIYPVGRLDEDSEGLILMTNDGDLANRLTHPRYEHEKEYKVLVAIQPDEHQLNAWRHGVVLEDGHRTAPAQVQVESTHGKGAWLRVILKEGRKRQIREMGQRIGLPVVRILRIRIGSLKLGNLKSGEWRELKPEEIRQLKEPAPSVSRPRMAGETAKTPRPERARQPITRPSTQPKRANRPDRRPTRKPAVDRGRSPRSGPKTPRK